MWIIKCKKCDSKVYKTINYRLNECYIHCTPCKTHEIYNLGDDYRNNYKCEYENKPEIKEICE